MKHLRTFLFFCDILPRNPSAIKTQAGGEGRAREASMKRVRAGVLGLVLGCVTVGQANAQGPVAPPEVLFPKQRATTKTFYGWQILASGEVGSVVAVASVLVPESLFGSFYSSLGFVTGMPVYALGGSIVHWIYNDFTKGAVSFGGNAAFALVEG